MKIEELPTAWNVYNKITESMNLTWWQKLYLFVRYDIPYWFIIRRERFKDRFR